MNKSKISKLKDYTEKTWFLGTDILESQDLDLMEKQICTSFEREEGAMYYIGHETNLLEKFHMAGYSETFLSVVNEAFKRKYVWIFFDRDIESCYK